jgi:hypothetical protein
VHVTTDNSCIEYKNIQIEEIIMNREKLISDFWNYYLLLEDQFIRSSNFVEISLDNYETYSTVFVNLLLSLGSEIDVLFREICGFMPGGRENMSNYISVYLPNHNNIVNEEIIIKYRNLNITPFKNWNIQQPAVSLFWWEKYNSIKHSRTANFKDANLHNVLYSLAALYLLLMQQFKDVASGQEPDIPDIPSKIFMIKGWKTTHIAGAETMIELDDNGNQVIDGGTWQ